MTFSNSNLLRTVLVAPSLAKNFLRKELFRSMTFLEPVPSAARPFSLRCLILKFLVDPVKKISFRNIPTRGADYAHHITACPPWFENLTASLFQVSVWEKLMKLFIPVLVLKLQPLKKHSPQSLTKEERARNRIWLQSLLHRK